MPAAVAVPLALAGVSLISGNAQQKAADKNNQNQQTASVNNAQQASQAAQAAYNNYAGAHPSPFASVNVRRPNQPNPQVSSTAGRIMQAAAPTGGVTLPPPQPALAPPQPPNATLVNAILSGSV